MKLKNEMAGVARLFAEPASASLRGTPHSPYHLSLKHKTRICPEYPTPKIKEKTKKTKKKPEFPHKSAMRAVRDLDTAMSFAGTFAGEKMDREEFYKKTIFMNVFGFLFF